MNAVEIEQAGMQSTVGRDCRERLPTRRANDWIAEKRSPVISVARSRVCADGRGIRAAHPVSPAGAWRHGIPVPGETGRRGGTSAEHWMLIGKWD